LPSVLLSLRFTRQCTWDVGCKYSCCTSSQKNVGNSSDGRSQEVPKISRHPCIGRMGALRGHLCDSTAFLLSLTLSVCPSVCLFVCHKHCFFFFVSRWNRAIFWPSVLHDKNFKMFSSIFDLGPLTPKIYFTPRNFHLWVTESVIVCGSTTFGLGAEIQSPTGLLLLLLLFSSSSSVVVVV